MTLDEERKKEEEEVPPQFSPLSDGRNDELDRSLPSTAPSTGRQELSVDTVPLPETTVPEDTLPSLPVETPQVPIDTVQDDEESIPEEIMDDTVERSTVPSRALFSPIESSSSRSEESENSGGRGGITVDGGKGTVGQSIEEITGSSDDTEDEKIIDVSAASLKKVREFKEWEYIIDWMFSIGQILMV